ncbi:MAG: hypothetical protein MI975_12170, partial [Cytophagales bacterium]|nr:hypothetical protein [Cytophagales bacterium]
MSHKSLRSVNPYLFFSGNCKEALDFYQGILGGNLEVMPFEGSPVDVPDDYKQKVMHASLRIGDAVIMVSDGMPGKDVPKGHMTSL